MLFKMNRRTNSMMWLRTLALLLLPALLMTNCKKIRGS